MIFKGKQKLQRLVAEYTFNLFTNYLKYLILSYWNTNSRGAVTKITLEM